MVTKIDALRTSQARAYIGSNLPTTPFIYYGTSAQDVDSVEWRGGEMAYLTTDNRFYIQTATSGTTSVWKRLLEATVSV